jgi:hypothetical protein
LRNFFKIKKILVQRRKKILYEAERCLKLFYETILQEESTYVPVCVIYFHKYNIFIPLMGKKIFFYE